jgi:hypothetical protein
MGRTLGVSGAKFKLFGGRVLGEGPVTQFGGNATRIGGADFSTLGAHFYAEIRLILRREKPIVSLNKEP